MPAGMSTDSVLRRGLDARARRTRRTGSGPTLPSPPQTSQAWARTIWPKAVLRDGAQLAGAAAALAGLDRGAGLGAVAVAVLARLDRVVGHLDLDAARGLLERDLDLHADVAALHGTRAAAAAAERVAAEERVEDVAERAEAVRLAGVAALESSPSQPWRS